MIGEQDSKSIARLRAEALTQVRLEDVPGKVADVILRTIEQIPAGRTGDRWPLADLAHRIGSDTGEVWEGLRVGASVGALSSASLDTETGLVTVALPAT